MYSIRWANVTLGLPCMVENTAYIAYGGTDSPGGEFIDIVSRFVFFFRARQ